MFFLFYWWWSSSFYEKEEEEEKSIYVSLLFLHLHWTIKKNFPEKFSIKKIKIIIINRERERESKRMNRKEMMSIKFILLFVNHGCEWKIANCRMGKESFSGRKNLFVFYGKYSLSFFFDWLYDHKFILSGKYSRTLKLQKKASLSFVKAKKQTIFPVILLLPIWLLLFNRNTVYLPFFWENFPEYSVVGLWQI